MLTTARLTTARLTTARPTTPSGPYRGHDLAREPVVRVGLPRRGRDIGLRVLAWPGADVIAGGDRVDLGW